MEHSVVASEVLQFAAKSFLITTFTSPTGSLMHDFQNMRRKPREFGDVLQAVAGISSRQWSRCFLKAMVRETSTRKYLPPLGLGQVLWEIL